MSTLQLDLFAAGGLRVRTSNRLEILLDALAQTIAESPLGPLEREVIVVQSRGMYRWVTLGLARRLGIAATLATPFPGTFCRALVERIVECHDVVASDRYEPTGDSPFDRTALTWRIFERLARATAHPELAPLASYLDDDVDQRKRYQLADRLAALLDEYQLYRGEWLLAWERGEQPLGGAHEATAAWQAALWRSIIADTRAAHLASQLRAAIDSLSTAKTAPAGLPSRVSVFGASSLPPIFVNLLRTLGRFAAVDVYVVSPTREYWADIRSTREARRLDTRLRSQGAPEDASVPEQTNELLASLGRQGRDLFGLLLDADPTGSAWQELRFAVPPGDDALGRIQRDVLDLVHRGESSSEHEELVEDDCSLQIHVCHSPMREVEVLRDAILRAFVDDASLRPHDVFVLLPDVETYAPYVDAVFGVDREGEPSLPYSIADRALRREHAVADATLRILDLVGGRLSAGAVLDALGAAPIRRAAHIDERELVQVRDWARATNACWGADAAHRHALLGVDAGETNTWRASMDRLLLGYAMGPSNAIVAGVLPYATATGGDAELIGRATAFMDTLLRTVRALERPRTLARWADDLGAAIGRLIAPQGDVEAQAFQVVLAAIESLRAGEATMEVAAEITVEVVRDHLRSALEEQGAAGGFITGAITFCALRPMRALPGAVLCIAGLNEGAFPHPDRPPTFDLIAATRTRGDRSPREDDRYAFLECVLAARRRLILSYVGRSEKDNSEVAPSIVLSELIDQIDRTFLPRDGQPASRQLTFEHRLQPFSAEYFTASKSPHSYSLENLEAARAALGGSSEQHFVTTPLDPADEPLDLTLEELSEFWVNPCKHFATRVLGLRLPRPEEALADAEPFGLGHLARYGLLERMIAARLEGRAAGDEELAALRAAGELPLAGLAHSHYIALCDEVDQLTAKLPPLAGRRRIDVELTGVDWRLTGSIDDVTDAAHVRWRPASSIMAKDRMRAWIAHLALCATMDTRAPQTRIIAKCKKPEHLERVVRPHEHLAALIAGYREGSRRPLPVYAESSYAFAAREAKPVKGSSPLNEARKKWEPGYSRKRGERGDSEDPYIALCTRDREPFDAEFEDRARELWKPFFDARASG
jgi:exodeoxyribonuclease V gamma subunit